MRRLLILICVVISTAVYAQDYEYDVDLDLGLISYYPFNGNADDVVGNNHGKVLGPINEDGRCGDMAYRFNGHEDYIDCGNDLSLNGNFYGLTLSVWVRPGEISELQLATIIGKWAFDTNDDHFGLWLNSSYKVIMAVSSAGIMENGVFSKSTLSYDEWHHVVGTWNRNGEIRIYIDGKLDKVDRQTGRGINRRSDASLKIGRQVLKRSRPFKGYLDEVRIYKRPINPAEVLALYNQGKTMCEKIIVRGRVLDKNTREPVQAEVIFENLEEGKLFNKVNTHGEWAEYEIELPLGEKFGFYANAENYLAENQNINTETKVNGQEIERDLLVIPVEIGQTMRLNNIFFDFNESTLKKESRHELDRLLSIFDRYRTLKIELAGHTDYVGSDQYNLKLSDARAKAVRKYLLSKGIDPERIVANGYGENYPVADNETEEGRQLNRRVEFRVLDK